MDVLNVSARCGKWGVGGRLMAQLISSPVAASIMGIRAGGRPSHGSIGPRLSRHAQENARLKKLVADLSLDNAILKEAAYPNS